MKRICAVVRPTMLEPLKEALFQANVSGMTISQVHGCGNQHGWSEYFRGNEVILNMVPKIKFEIIADDAQVDAIVDVIVSTARAGKWAMARSSFRISNVSCAFEQARKTTQRSSVKPCVKTRVSLGDFRERHGKMV